MREFSTRRASATHGPTLAQLVDMHNACFPSIIFPMDDGHWWIVWRDGQPAAFALLTGAEWFPNSGYFARVGVLRPHRGHGLQLRLMGVAERKAKKLGWAAMISDTTDVPHSAANFERRGYTSFTPTTPWGMNTRTLYWRKEL